MSAIEALVIFVLGVVVGVAAGIVATAAAHVTPPATYVVFFGTTVLGVAITDRLLRG